jgi:hypothetical protein
MEDNISTLRDETPELFELILIGSHIEVERMIKKLHSKHDIKGAIASEYIDEIRNAWQASMRGELLEDYFQRIRSELIKEKSASTPKMLLIRDYQKFIDKSRRSELSLH